MTRDCRNCGSNAINKVSTELSFARGIAAVPIYALGTMSVCLECGLAEYVVPEESLAQLRQGAGAGIFESGQM